MNDPTVMVAELVGRVSDKIYDDLDRIVDILEGLEKRISILENKKKESEKI